MGRYTQIAISGREIQFPIDNIFYKQLTLSGSICYTARTWERMMKIFAQGRVRLGDIISARLPLSDWRTAFDLCVEKRPESAPTPRSIGRLTGAAPPYRTVALSQGSGAVQGGSDPANGTARSMLRVETRP